MRGVRRETDPAVRRAMTLVEVVLALCLLVVLASITWPALDRPMADHRLRKAADVVRVQWSRARIKAISSGQTQIFRFAPETGRFLVESQPGPEYADQAAATTLAAAAESTAVSGVIERALPDKITFVAGQTEYEARAEVLASDTQNLPAECDWSDPIVFYPDGTASTATLTLQNEHGRTIELFLRGITGLASLGNVQSGEGFVP